VAAGKGGNILKLQDEELVVCIAMEILKLLPYFQASGMVATGGFKVKPF
jgi:hypothetical protein